MFNGNYNYNNRSNRSGRPAFGRNSGGNFRLSGRRNNLGAVQKISFSRFIKKAKSTVMEKPYESKNAFADFAVCEPLKNNIAAKGYIAPTPIQDQAIPMVLTGADIVGIANTGTGKTAAFLIPLLDKVFKDARENILIVVPTRELAIQINEEFMGFRGRLKIFSVCCVGGMNIRQQIYDLRRTHNFIIGTPGRLKDLVQRGDINLSRFKTIVLDEADRMLDMGFVGDMRFIMSRMAASRQTLFFSATITSEIDKFIKEFLSEPVKVSVKKGETAENVEQDIVRVEQGANKIDVLCDLLSRPEFSKVLIFGRTKYGVEKLSKTLNKKGLKTESIHGNKNHAKRQKALISFKKDLTQILVATDVAARGLDIPNVSHVVNFDIPATYEDYIHRIGRTGRGDAMGKALTFID